MPKYERIDNTLRIDCSRWVISPRIEDSEAAMGVVVDILLREKGVERIIMSEVRENEYDYEQVKLLYSIAETYNKIIFEKELLLPNKICVCGKHQERIKKLKYLIMEVWRKDPIGAYVRILSWITKVEGVEDFCTKNFFKKCLNPIRELMESSAIIQEAKPKLSRFKLGDRSIYREIFSPIIRPAFMFTRFKMLPPKNGKLVDKYYVDGNKVEIYRIPGKIRFHYHVYLKEFLLSEREHSLLEEARRVLISRRPSEIETKDPIKAREVFTEFARGIIKEVSMARGIRLSYEKVEELTKILVRYTFGFGILEVILSDPKVQDVYINSPVGETPVYLYHSDFEECETNLIPSPQDAEAWATRFRLYSGRPLDESSPVLDTELFVPGGRARVAAITRTLSPEGLAFAFRRHREKPWTFPLFIKAKMFNPLYAGVMNFIIDGGRSLLIAGGRSSGKTSLLSAVILEILRRFRVIVQEDSVTGDCEILIRRNGKVERVRIGELVDGLLKRYGFEKAEGREILSKNPENIQVLSIDSNLKVKWSKVSQFIRHKVRKDIFEVMTRSGRRIRVTGDHSLFSINEIGKLMPVKVSELKVGDHIAVPRFIPLKNKPKTHVNLMNHLNKLNGNFWITGKEIGKLLEERKNEIKEMAIKLGYSRYSLSHWRRKEMLPIKLVKLLIKNVRFKELNKLWIRDRKGKKIPIIFELTPEFLKFVGLWLADGCYDDFSTIISVGDENCRKVVKRFANKLGFSCRMHSDGVSLVIDSKLLKEILQKIFELKGNAYTKRIPSWVFGLSKKQVSYVLSGIFSGDGCVGKYEVVIPLSSLNLLKDIQTLLLPFGILLKIGKFDPTDKTYDARISGIEFIRKFKSNIGFLQEYKNLKLLQIAEKTPTHDITDIIPFPLLTKAILCAYTPLSFSDYVTRGFNIGRKKFGRIVKTTCLPSFLTNLATSDIFWDEIKSIKRIESKQTYVYDLSVPETENFVCENILAHNTLEIPVTQIRKLGYNIERLKSRSVITKVEIELPAEEALRTALRLGDSALIIGEIRSSEALALFEAMRIGALANIVAGTIHAETAYGVFDRVVNDLGVPKTSFKAIDLITICSRLKSPDGLHTFRRVIELTEVRKKWAEDPLEEGAFVKLFEYSAKEDTLKPTETLLYGESFILNEIAKRVREWRGHWDRVWDNILLRAKIKETLVNYAERLNRPEILEAEFSVKANEMFHLISEQVKQELGGLDSKVIFERWEDWLKKELRK